MDYKVNRCKICYSELKIQSGKDKYVKCPYCGCINVAEITDSLYQEKLDGIYRYLRDAEFEKANEALRDLLKKYPKNGELYFIKVLIDSRIVYVDDGEKKIPTYTNINFEIDNKDNAKKAIDYTDNPEEKKFYKAQLELIEKDKEEIQKIISSKENKYNYDVFISFKKSVIGDPSKDTEDFKLADKIYKHLLKEHHNLKVFYAPESLKAGESWERQIFNALYRSKCMIVIGSDIDNLNSPWVKNEWNRYLEMLNAGKKAPNSLIPVVIGGDFYSVLPSKLSAIQGLAADVSLLNELSKMLDELFLEDNEEKKIEAKKYNSFSGVKVSKSKSKEDDIDLDAIIVLAETDKKLALREIKKFDQDSPSVKEALFSIENGNICKEETYDKNHNSEEFFTGLADIVNGNNITKIAKTIIKYVESDRFKVVNKTSAIRFILPYIENLSSADNKNVIRSSIKHLKAVFASNINKEGEDYDSVSKTVDIVLTLNECSDEDKQDLLFNYCCYLNNVITYKINNNEDISNIESVLNDHVEYLNYEPYVLKKSPYKPFAAKLSDFKYLNMCSDNVNKREYVYANLVMNYSRACKYVDAYNALDKLIKETDNYELGVIFNYLKMIAAFSNILVKRDLDTSLLDKSYDETSIYIAKNIKNASLLMNLKERYNTLKTLISDYSNETNVFDLKAPSYNKVSTSLLLLKIHDYNEDLWQTLRFYWELYDEKRLETFTVLKSNKSIDTKIESFKANFDFLPHQDVYTHLLTKCLNGGYYDSAEDLIEFLISKGYEPSLFYEIRKSFKKQKSRIAKEKIKKKIGAGASVVTSGAGTGFKAIGIFMLGYGGMFIYIVATILQFLFFHDVNFMLYTSIAQIVGFIYTYIRHLIIREEDDFEFNFSNILLNIFAHYGWFLVFYIASTMDPGGENKILLIPTIVNSLLFVANYVVQFINLGDAESAGVCVHLNPFISVGALAASLVPFYMYSFGKQPEFIFYVEGIYNAAEPNINIYFNLFIAVLLISQAVLNSISAFIMYSDDSGSPWIVAVANLLVVAAAIVFIVAVFTIAPEGEGEAVDAFWNFYVGSVTPAFITAIGGGIATLVGFFLPLE